MQTCLSENKYIIIYKMIKFTKELIKRGANKITNAVRSTFKSNSYFSKVDRYLKDMNRPLYSYIILANFGVFALWKIP